MGLDISKVVGSLGSNVSSAVGKISTKTGLPAQVASGVVVGTTKNIGSSKLTNALTCLAAEKMPIVKSACLKPLNSVQARRSDSYLTHFLNARQEITNQKFVDPILCSLVGKTCPKPAPYEQVFLKTLADESIRNGLGEKKALIGAAKFLRATGLPSGKDAQDSAKFFQKAGLINARNFKF